MKNQARINGVSFIHVAGQALYTTTSQSNLSYNGGKPSRHVGHCSLYLIADSRQAVW